MAEGGSNASADVTTCSICLEHFKKPKLLPCHHTFCAHCLRDYIEKSSHDNVFDCPMCRKSTAVPVGGVEEYQTNFYIPQEVYAKNKIIPCDICGPEAPSDHRCLDCEENFCSACSNAHLKMKATRQHSLIELTSADPTTKRRIVSKVFCQEHPSEEIKMFCKDCNVVLCIMCTLTGHKTHTSSEISKEAKAVRQKLSDLIKGDSPLKGCLESIQMTITRIEASDNRLTTMEEKDIYNIDAQVEVVKKAAILAGESLKKDARNKYEIVLKENKRELDRLRLHEKEIISEVGMTQNAITEKADVNIVQASSQIEERLRCLSKQKRASFRKFHQDGLFRSTDINDSVIRSLLGSVKKFTKNALPENLSPSLLSVIKLKSRGPYAYGIAPIGEEIAWISTRRDPEVCLIHVSGEVKMGVNVGAGSDFVTADSKGNCYLSFPTDHCVKIVSRTGVITTLISGLPLHPHGLAVRTTACGDELLLSCTDEQDAQDICGKGTVMSISLTDPKKEAKTILSQLKSIPRIAVDEDGEDLCLVSDFRQNSVGIFALPDDTSDTPKPIRTITVPSLSPIGLTYDNVGCIICANMSDEQKSIIRMKADGSRLQTLITGRGVRSIAVRGDILWVGLLNNSIEVYKLTAID